MRRILFTKYSNERDVRFAVRTDIWEEYGVKGVSKQAFYPQGQKHIENIYHIFQKLEQLFQNTKIQINQCKLETKEISFEYMTGDTLQTILDNLLKEGKKKEFKSLLFEYIELIKKTADQNFTVTPEFQQIFGDIEVAEKFSSASVTDIDMVLGNVIVQGGKWTLIDYEWTFSFPIPIHFVIYRLLHYYEKSNAFRNQIAEWNLYEETGIGQKEQEIFQEMEKNFQKYILGNYVPLRDLYPRISPGTVTFAQLLENQFQDEKLQVFVSRDGISREEDSKCFIMNYGRAKVELAVEENISFIRLDPGEKMGRVIIRKLQWESGEKCQIRTNGLQKSDREWIFLTEDPQIYIVTVPFNGGKLIIDLVKDFDLKNYAKEILEEKDKIIRQEQQIIELMNQLREKERLIQNMENTKVWKAYKKYKKMIKGE